MVHFISRFPAVIRAYNKRSSEGSVHGMDNLASDLELIASNSRGFLTYSIKYAMMPAMSKKREMTPVEQTYVDKSIAIVEAQKKISPVGSIPLAKDGILYSVFMDGIHKGKQLSKSTALLHTDPKKRLTRQEKQVTKIFAQKLLVAKYMQGENQVVLSEVAIKGFLGKKGTLSVVRIDFPFGEPQNAGVTVSRFAREATAAGYNPVPFGIRPRFNNGALYAAVYKPNRRNIRNG